MQGYGCLAVAHLAWHPTNRDRLLGMGGKRTLETAALALEGRQQQEQQHGTADPHARSSLGAVIAQAQEELTADESAECSVQ